MRTGQKETVKQYTRRLMSYSSQRESFDVFASTPAKLRRLIAGRRRRNLVAPREEGKWSVAEILSHLVDAEIALSFRIRMILSSNGTPLQAYDQDVWAGNQRLAPMAPLDSLGLFAALRNANARLLDRIPARRWNDFGMHAERGKETIGRLVRLHAGHDINHLRQVRDLLKKGVIR